MPRLDGFDGAHYQTAQAEPNLVATLLAGLWWIAWKATQSTAYVDPTFARIRSAWTGFRMRGIYHWLSSTSDVAAQAAHYLRTIGSLARGEFVMLDAEEKGITVAMCLLWCELVEAITHRPVVIYTGLYVAGGTIWNSPELRMSKYGPRPFIVAAYVSEANLLARMAALHALPRDGWQFGSNGPVPGIVGRCDMDQIDNVAAFELACEISHIVPQPIGDDMPAFISNKTAGKYGAAPSPQGGCTIWELVRDDLRYHKNALSFPEWVAFGQPFGVVCDDATLDQISDYTPPVAGAAGGPLKIQATLVGTAIPDGG